MRKTKPPKANNFLFYWTITLSVIFLLFGCKSAKHIEKDSSSKEERKSVNTDSLVKLKVDSVRSYYEEKLKTLDADIVFDTGCDTMWIDTGTFRTNIVNMVKYIPGKGFEASGAIKTFKLKESELLKTIDYMSLQMEQEINLRIKAEELLKEERATKKVDKETKWFSWWLLLAAYALGVFFPPMKILNTIRNLSR